MRLLVSILISLLFISSCSSINHAKKTDKIGTAQIRESTHNRVQGSGRIQLLPHQLVPIDYLLNHPEQKGLLVNHYMGTGKTYLGIGFAQAFPDHPVIILAPRFLESNWKNQLQEFGATNPNRFSFISYEDAPTKLAGMDLSRHIILADEVHNLVKKMRSIDREANALYTEVYSNLRKAYKIIGLSGTPIYGDESDIAFILNLVSGEDLMPFNQETFRLKYTQILPTPQFFRGYLTESNLMISTLPPILGLFFARLAGSIYGAAIGFPLGILAPVLINHWADLTSFRLRQLDTQKMTPVFQKYMSYFKFDESHFKDFPPQDFKIVEVPYNKYQYSFFLHLVEGDLPSDQLKRLLENENIKKTDEFIKINSSNLHEQIYSSIGAGRDIGNFDFLSSDGTLVEAPKFLKIYEELKKNKERTVIYSSYYQTGILAFENFLKRQNYAEKFATIHPNLKVDEVNKIVSDYNQGRIRLLMLHPDITEGISLKGTQYLHILEPMLNSTVLEQVIGRTRRFQSHSDLPKEKQLVHVRMWQSTSSNWNAEIGGLSRVNWYKRYRELAYMSRWGIGISQVDKKYDRKALNPEELSLIKLQTLEKNLGEIQKILTTESIENDYQKVVVN